METKRANKSTRAVVLWLLLVGLTLAGSFGGLVITFLGAAQTMAEEQPQAQLQVTRTASESPAVLMPGDHAVVTYEVTAGSDVAYAVRADASPEGESVLRVRITDLRTGATLYEGGLGQAAVDNRPLPSGVVDQIAMDIYLPLETSTPTPPNSLTASWTFTATPTSAS